MPWDPNIFPMGGLPLSLPGPRFLRDLPPTRDPGIIPALPTDLPTVVPKLPWRDPPVVPPGRDTIDPTGGLPARLHSTGTGSASFKKWNGG